MRDQRRMGVLVKHRFLMPKGRGDVAALCPMLRIYSYKSGSIGLFY